MNFALMYLLAPTAAAVAGGTAGQSLLVRALSEEFLVKWGAPGQHESWRPAVGMCHAIQQHAVHHRHLIFFVIVMTCLVVNVICSSGSRGLSYVSWCSSARRDRLSCI